MPNTLVIDCIDSTTETILGNRKTHFQKHGDI